MSKETIASLTSNHHCNVLTKVEGKLTIAMQPVRGRLSMGCRFERVYDMIKGHDGNADLGNRMTG
jgi:hypothetical protein